MKNASAAVLAILNTTGSVQILRADLYTITPKNGPVLRYTDADIPLTVGGNTFIRGPILQRSKTKQSVGITVDTMQVTLVDNGATLVQGKPIVHQFKNGYFKGATMKVEKLFLLSWADTSPGAVHWFEGSISEPACDHMSVSFQVKSLLATLNKQMPEDIYQPTCGNTLFDSVCGANAATFTFGACTATSVVDRKRFTLSGTSQADGYFALGKVKFTSGANAGQPARTVKSYIGGVIEVFQPFPYPIANGDACAATAGCDKLRGTCNTKFNRLATGFQATPYVPVPETAIEGGGVGGTAPSQGGNGTVIVGSGVGAGRRPGTYVIS